MPDRVKISVELSTRLHDPAATLRSLLVPVCASGYEVRSSIDSLAPDFARFLTIEIGAADKDRVMACLEGSDAVVDAVPEPEAEG